MTEAEVIQLTKFEQLERIRLTEKALYVTYETLSNIFFNYPTEMMVYALDELKDVQERVRVWRIEFEMTVEPIKEA